MFMSVLKHNKSGQLSSIDFQLVYLQKGSKYILSWNNIALYLKKQFTNLYEGSISISDLAKPLGLTSPSLSAKLSKAS